MILVSQRPMERRCGRARSWCEAYVVLVSLLGVVIRGDAVLMAMWEEFSEA